jgi:hypothetical protein
MDPYSGVWREVGRGDFRGSMEVRVSGVENKVTVVFNEYIVPHIFANSYRDAAYALGYIHVYYRLWQMDMQRRLTEGGLSEVLGNSTLKQDILISSSLPLVSPPSESHFIGIHIAGLLPLWVIPTHSSTFIASSGSLLLGSPRHTRIWGFSRCVPRIHRSC